MNKTCFLLSEELIVSQGHDFVLKPILKLLMRLLPALAIDSSLAPEFTEQPLLIFIYSVIILLLKFINELQIKRFCLHWSPSLTLKAYLPSPIPLGLFKKKSKGNF